MFAAIILVTVTTLLLLWIFFPLCRSVNLQKKVVMITGASSGLGRSCCFEFMRRGCQIILCSRNKEELKEVKAELESEGNACGFNTEHKVFPLDVTDFENVTSTTSEILACFDVDILINNAGISSRGDVLSTELDVFQKVITVNYLGQIAVTKAILPHMTKKRSGHIVGIGSIQGKIAQPHRAPYSASKHAMQSFYDSLRAEVSDPFNIKVTTINPSYIKTNVSRNALQGDGSSFGKSDVATESGYDAEYIAKVVADSVTSQKEEVLIAPLLHRVAVWLRFYAPSLYFWVMAKRAATPHH